MNTLVDIGGGEGVERTKPHQNVQTEKLSSLKPVVTTINNKYEVTLK